MQRTRLLAELVDPTSQQLDREAWALAHRERTPVAVCRCGALAVTDPTGPEHVAHFGARWYTIRCESCGQESEINDTRKLETTGRPSRSLRAQAALVEARKLADR